MQCVEVVEHGLRWAPGQRPERLQQLVLGHKELRDLSLLSSPDFVQYRKQIVALQLPFNQITSLAHIRGFSALERLNVSHNKLKSLVELAELPGQHLKSLKCSHNKLTTLEHAGRCVDLEELWVQRNQIKTLAELHHLRDCRKLKHLIFAPQPCCKGGTSVYRAIVLYFLPNLEVIDIKPVTEQERAAAAERWRFAGPSGIGFYPRPPSQGVDNKVNAEQKEQKSAQPSRKGGSKPRSRGTGGKRRVAKLPRAHSSSTVLASTETDEQDALSQFASTHSLNWSPSQQHRGAKCDTKSRLKHSGAGRSRKGTLRKSASSGGQPKDTLSRTANSSRRRTAGRPRAQSSQSVSRLRRAVHSLPDFTHLPRDHHKPDYLTRRRATQEKKRRARAKRATALGATLPRSQSAASVGPAPHVVGVQNPNRRTSKVVVYSDGSAKGTWPDSSLAVSVTRIADATEDSSVADKLFKLYAAYKSSEMLALATTRQGSVNYSGGRTFLYWDADGGMAMARDGRMLLRWDSDKDVLFYDDPFSEATAVVKRKMSENFHVHFDIRTYVLSLTFTDKTVSHTFACGANQPAAPAPASASSTRKLARKQRAAVVTRAAKPKPKPMATTSSPSAAADTGSGHRTQPAGDVTASSPPTSERVVEEENKDIPEQSEVDVSGSDLESRRALSKIRAISSGIIDFGSLLKSLPSSSE